jgi:predicted RNA-binding Zn-ribbon protein involved in translation (DUF1610 family)
VKLKDVKRFHPWEPADEEELPELVYAVHDCPRCGAPAPARGLAVTMPTPHVVYECVACGEVTLHHCAP